jgi:hypothetical protein
VLKPIRVVERQKAWEGVGKGRTRCIRSCLRTGNPLRSRSEETAPIVKDDRTRQGSRHPGCQGPSKRVPHASWCE